MVKYNKILKTKMASALILTMLCQMAVPTYASVPENSAAVTITESLRGRQVQNLNDGWTFYKGEADGAEAIGYDDSSWEAVSVPHCWNAEDGADGGGNYYRGTGWYRRHLQWDDSWIEKKLYLEFEGVSQEADIYVNGIHVGNHKGGYTLFRYDITPYLIAGDNVIAVKANNRNGGKTDTRIAPIVGDFTVYGGMYRDVQLIVTDLVHVDAVGTKSEDGNYDTAPSAGLYLATSEVSDGSATLTVQSEIVNDGTEDRQVTVTAELKNPDSFEEIAEIEVPLLFNPEEMAPGGTVKTVEETVTIPAGESHVFKKEITVENPHLWNGITDPYQYETVLTVSSDGKVLDQVSDHVGFRYYSVDWEKGFFLNGKSYPLRGVSRHQDLKGKGYALSEEDHNRDFALIYEMGANSVRLAHYPQDSYMYDLCDRYGIVVWAEIPYIGGNNETKYTEANEELRKTTKQQLRELILQQYNHPSILVWGLENEVGHQANAELAKGWIEDMNRLAHELDPSRMTTMATNNGQAYNWESDLLAWNTYPGWYGGNFNNLGSTMDNNKAGDKKKRPVGISEYGAGAHPYQHEYNEKTNIGNPGGAWHPEEFQSDLHEAAIRAINERPYLWCTYVWNMFDFGSDSRNEGEQPGINDKGLVTYDRSLKKDSFYLYKANWNKTDKFVHLASGRFNPRDTVDIPVLKVYSNCDSVSVSINGQSPIKGENTGCGVFVWKDLKFPVQGDNTVVATGAYEGGTATDTVVWQRSKGKDVRISSDVLDIDLEKRTIDLTTQLQVESLNEVIHFAEGQTWRVLKKSEEGMEAVSSGEILVNMYLEVTAEDGQTQALYQFMPASLSFEKEITASAEKDGYPVHNAMDLDENTRWIGGRIYDNPYEITVDLEDAYRLTEMTIDWYNEKQIPRSYYYQIQTSKDGNSWYTVADCSQNTKTGVVETSLNEQEARYVKVRILGCSNPGLECSIREMSINGFRMEAGKHQIDHTNHVIHIDDTGVTNFEPKDFEKDLIFEGDAQYRWELGGNYFLIDGSKFIITTKQGQEIIYWIDMPQGEMVKANVAQGKPVTFSSQQVTETEPNAADNINDGNKDTRWAAENAGAAKFPEWVTIDLGEVYDLSQIKVLFYKAGERIYQYEILGSLNGKDFDSLVNKKGNQDKTGDYSHEMTGKQARYIKLNVTGSPNGGTWGLASAYELEVYGSAESVTAYSVSGIVQNTETGEGISGVNVGLYAVDDTEYRNLLASTAAGVDGRFVLNQVPQGEYVLRMLGHEFSGSQKFSVQDADVSDVVLVAVREEEKEVPISLGKDVTCSSEEIASAGGQDDNLAAHINDGNLESRWSGKVVNGTAAGYPQWVTIDLGDVYDLSRVDLLFYKHGSADGGRIYQYQLLTSMTGEEGSFQMTADVSDNNTPGGKYSHDLNEQARYVRVMVTGCNETQKWVSASIHEMSVYGTKAEVPETYSVSGAVQTAEGTAAEDFTVHLYQEELATPSQLLASPSQITRTDSLGNYRFDNVEAGVYTVEIPAQKGYRRAEESVELTAGSMENVNFYLEADGEPEVPESLELKVQKLPDKVCYHIGEALDPIGLEVALYQDGELERILSEEEYELSSLESETAGKKKITVRHTTEDGQNLETYFEVLVVKDAEPAIKVVKLPHKLIYGLDEELETSGMEVRGLNLGEEEITVLDESEYELVYDFSEVSVTEVQVIYTGSVLEELGDVFELSDRFEVMVVDFMPYCVDHIRITQEPYRNVYEPDSELELEGLKVEKVVKASDSNAEFAEPVSLDELVIEAEDDLESTGKKEIQVAYYAEGEDGEEQKFTDQFTVTVSRKEELVAEDQLRAAMLWLEDQLKKENYLTDEEKHEAFAAAISYQKQGLEIMEDSGELTKDMINILGDTEQLIFENCDHIQIGAQADEDLGEIEYLGLAFSADFESENSQKLELRIRRSQEGVSSEILDKVKGYCALDISFYLNGNEIQPTLPIFLRMRIPENLKANNLVILRDMNGDICKTEPEVSGSWMRFAVTESDIYVIANPFEKTYSDDDSDGDTGVWEPDYHLPGQWVKDETGWWYQKTSGGYVKDAWARIKGIWYYFDTDGYMKNGWLFYKNQWYYLEADGSMACDRWLLSNDRWYYLQSDGTMLAENWKFWKDKWYYMQSDGAMLSDGWKLWKDKWYYLQKDGSMATDTVLPDGSRVDAQGVYTAAK